MIGKKGKVSQEISGTHMFHISSFMVNLPFTKSLCKDLGGPQTHEQKYMFCLDNKYIGKQVMMEMYLAITRPNINMLVAHLCPALCGLQTGACQASLSEQFSRQYWSRLTLNLGLLHCMQVLYHLSHQGSPNINIYPLKY